MLSLKNLALIAKSTLIKAIENIEVSVTNVEDKSEISFARAIIQGVTFNFAYYREAETFNTINVYEDLTEDDCLRFRVKLEKNSKAALILKLMMEDWTDKNKRELLKKAKNDVYNLELELA
jgi:hypothetical protein